MKDPIYMLFGNEAAKIFEDEYGQQTALVYDAEKGAFRPNQHFLLRLSMPNDLSETVLSKEEFEREVATQRKEWLARQQRPHLVEEARQFAIGAHGGQRYGNLPYQSHLESVVSFADLFLMPDRIVAAAYLHDVLEDCPDVTAKDLEKRFGKDVARLVVAVTKQPGDTPQQYFQRIRAAGPEAVFLKLADRLSNVRACVSEQPNSELLEKYRSEQPLLRSILFAPGKQEYFWNALEFDLGRAE